MPSSGPSIVVLSSLFPSAAQPVAGVFIKERMRRVARELPLCVISPQPWFPLQGFIRLLRPNYRIPRPTAELVDGLSVIRPRYLAFPSLFRRLDGLMMALAVRPHLRALKRIGRADVIDAHFVYPDGYAAACLGRWLALPVAVTMRGTEPGHAMRPSLRPKLESALRAASRVICVSDSLRQLALRLGAPTERTCVIGNGVDLQNFAPIPSGEARAVLGIAPGATVLISVGGLVERKGFHRVIACLPQLLRRFPNLLYLIAGGPSAEGDWTDRLRDQVKRLDLERHVRFLGAVAPADLRVPLSAANVFVLATRNEGWANVFLEAMACGLPVVTTRVGGNPEVVSGPDLGILVPFGDEDALREGIAQAIERKWNTEGIRRYAEQNSWEQRVGSLVAEFRALADAASQAPATQPAAA